MKDNEQKNLIGMWKEVIDAASASLDFSGIDKDQEHRIKRDFREYVCSRRTLAVPDKALWVEGIRKGLQQGLEHNGGLLSENEAIGLDKRIRRYLDAYSRLLWSFLSDSSTIAVSSAFWKQWSRKWAAYGAGGMVFSSTRIPAKSKCILIETMYGDRERKWEQVRLFVYNSAISRLVHNALTQKSFLTNMFLAPVAKDNLTKMDLLRIKQGVRDIEERISRELASFSAKGTFYYEMGRMSSYCELISQTDDKLDKTIDVENTNEGDWVTVDRIRK
jgi:hypothetical protein